VNHNKVQTEPSNGNLQLKKREAHMNSKRKISFEEARSVGAQFGLDWTHIGLEQFRRGLEVELEHSAHDPETNVTSDDLLLTGKIVWAHLEKIRDYYKWWDQLQAKAKFEP
jgi:uncharacterized protein DUF5661